MGEGVGVSEMGRLEVICVPLRSGRFLEGLEYQERG